MNFNFLSRIFGKKSRADLIDQNEKLFSYKSERLLKYIAGKYPNCPNSDYIKIIEKEREKFTTLQK